MNGWAIVLILSMAGIVAILLRRLPAALRAAVSLPVSASQQASASSKKAPEREVTKKKKPAAEPATIAELPSKNVDLSKLDLDQLQERGEALFRAQEYYLAKDIYAEMLRRKEDPKWFNRFGVINLELERFREARDAFRAALRFGASASRHANLGLAEYALGHRVTAISHLRKAIALAPNVIRYQELLQQIESDQQN